MISRAELIRDVMDERVSLGQLFLYDEEEAFIAMRRWRIRGSTTPRPSPASRPANTSAAG